MVIIITYSKICVGARISRILCVDVLFGWREIIVGGGHEQRLLGVYSRDIWGNFPTGPFILRRWVRQPRQWLEGLVRGWARLLIGPRSDLPGGPWVVPPESTFLNLPGGPGITSPATRLAQIGESVDSE